MYNRPQNSSSDTHELKYDPTLHYRNGCKMFKCDSLKIPPCNDSFLMSREANTPSHNQVNNTYSLEKEVKT